MLICIAGWAGNMPCRRLNRPMILTLKLKPHWPNKTGPMNCINQGQRGWTAAKAWPINASLKGLPKPPIAQVAQLVEQRTENPRVGGSIRPWAPFF